MVEVNEIVKWYKCNEEAIIQAEKLIGFEFPSELKTIYLKYGYGFVKNKINAINRLISPMGCADIRLREDIYAYDPDLDLIYGKRI